MAASCVPIPGSCRLPERVVIAGAGDGGGDRCILVQQPELTAQVLVCARCGGPRRILGAVTEPHACDACSPRSGSPPSRRRPAPSPPPDSFPIPSFPAASVSVCPPPRGAGSAHPLPVRRPRARLVGAPAGALHSGSREDGAPGGRRGHPGKEAEKGLPPPRLGLGAWLSSEARERLRNDRVVIFELSAATGS
jgi:hypothetical protein